MSGQVSRGSAGEYQADERAGVARLSWRVEKWARAFTRHQKGPWHRKGEEGLGRQSQSISYQSIHIFCFVDEHAGVARLSWRVSVR